MNNDISDIIGIRNRALKAVKWSALAEILSISMQPVVTLVLARLLTPEEFGIVAVATVAVGIAQLFQEFGMGKALIQARDYSQEYANIAFWVNSVLGIVIYSIIYVAAPSIAGFFNSTDCEPILKVLCIQIIITGFYSVHSSLMQRFMKFRKIFVVRFISSVFPGALSIVLAYRGMGVWSLVWGALFGSCGQLIFYWLLSEWRPKFSFDIQALQKLASFSKWIMLEAALAWSITNCDSVALGHYLGMKEVGIYRLSSSLIIFVSFCSMAPVVPVAFSWFSRLQGDREELRFTFMNLTRGLAALSLPLGFGIALLAKPIVTVVLGDKWLGAEIAIALLAIRFGISWVFGLSSTVFSAIGKPELNVALLVVGTLISLPVYIIAAPYGLMVFCFGRLITSMIVDLLGYMILSKALELPKRFYLQPLCLPLAGIMLMTLVLVGLQWGFGISSWYMLILAVILGALTYFVSLLVFNRDFVVNGYRYALQIMR